MAQNGARFGKQCLVWTEQKFPFSVKTAHALKIPEPPFITVTGKAFYDIGHAPADHSFKPEKHAEGYAVWEIHPVMGNGSDSMTYWEIVADNLQGRHIRY